MSADCTPRTITLLVLHCSATRCNQRYPFERCRSDHIHHRHFGDIGYHYYVEKDGSVHKGREENCIGAHVRNHNRHSIGICYEGGLDESGRPADTRTEAQKEALLTLLTQLKERYPRALIVGHRDLSPDLNHDGRITPNEWIKQCPCFDAATTYKELQPQ